MKPHRSLRIVALTIVLLTPVVSRAADVGTTKRVCEVAKARTLPDNAPKASDVIMRSLTLRVANEADPRDTFRALADFHVTRLEWAYIKNPAFIAKVQASGRVFGGAASSALSHVARTERDLDYADLACVNLNGVPVIPTWKRAWRPPGNLWMCVNNPAVERCYVEYLKSCMDAGAQVMQRDEPGGNENALSWGGCFCDYCVQAFRDYLAKNTTVEKQTQLGIDNINTFDYRDLLQRQGAPVGDDFRRWNGGELKQLFVQFQTEATVAFHRRTRQTLNEHVGRRVAISCNNGCRRWTPTELAFDWCFGELSYRHATPGFIHDAMQDARELDRCQVITMPKKSDREGLDAWHRLTRQTIALAYACGGHCMVPWDVYMPSDAPRYFGTPEQYADLYGFIRSCSQYLDGYEYAGAFGAGIECNLYDDAPPIRLTDDGNVCAVVRAIPKRADGAVVVHLIDWSDDPTSFQVSLNPTALFGDKALKMKLLVPAPYDMAAHKKAERTRMYAELAKTIPVESGYVTSVSVPALNPWGILVIEPENALEAGVWQLEFVPMDGMPEGPIRRARNESPPQLILQSVPPTIAAWDAGERATLARLRPSPRASAARNAGAATLSGNRCRIRLQSACSFCRGRSAVGRHALGAKVVRAEIPIANALDRRDVAACPPERPGVRLVAAFRPASASSDSRPHRS